MEDVLAAGVELADPLQETADRGFAVVPGALDPGFRMRLCAAVVDGPFTPAPTEVGAVRQQTESRELEPGEVHEAELLRIELVGAVREEGRAIRGLATWRPNEIAVQRYRSGTSGITPHRDGKRYRRLVAVLTLEGTARFSIHAARDGPPVAGWEAAPGDLTLLRAPGLAGHRDGRPFHAVGGPTTRPRLSLGLRMRAEA